MKGVTWYKLPVISKSWGCDGQHDDQGNTAVRCIQKLLKE